MHRRNLYEVEFKVILFRPHCAMLFEIRCRLGQMLATICFFFMLKDLFHLSIYCYIEGHALFLSSVYQSFQFLGGFCW